MPGLQGWGVVGVEVVVLVGASDVPCTPWVVEVFVVAAVWCLLLFVGARCGGDDVGGVSFAG